jgi:hypothetical protein
MSRTGNVLQNVLDLSSVAYFNSVAIYLKHARRLYTTLAIEPMAFSFTDENYFDHLHEGLRLAPDYIMIQIGINDILTWKFIQEVGSTKLIGYFPCTEASCARYWDSDELFDVYLKGRDLGCHIVQITQPAYKPPLPSEQLRRVYGLANRGWLGISGLEVLPEQAFAQFKLWTGRKAPRARMKEAMTKSFLEHEQHSPMFIGHL